MKILLRILPLANLKTITAIIGIIQGILKLVKEVLTALVNSALPFIPNDKVQKIRDVLNKIDGWLEAAKNGIFKLIGA